MRVRLLLTVAMLIAGGSLLSAAEPLLKLERGNKIVLIGNTLAERMQYFGNWETTLHGRFPEHNLVVRNLGWSGDTITVRLRSQDFQDHHHTLFDHQPDVILGFFGFNESFAGPQGVEQFKQDLTKFIADVRRLEYPSQTIMRFTEAPIEQDGQGAVTKTPQLVLVSPIANEDLADRNIRAGTRNNANIGQYTQAMAEVAKANDVLFVDLFHPTLHASERETPITFNGIHLTESGDVFVGDLLNQALFGAVTEPDSGDAKEHYLAGAARMSALGREVDEKNLQHWHDYRAVNGYYIYGDRKKPFGVVNFPAEFEKLRKMVAVRDERVWKVARGEEVPERIDDSGTGDFVTIETNFKNEIQITTPEESLARLTVPEGFEVNLWASEVQFPNLENPVQFTFDAQGRMWLVTMPTYPMYLPGTPVNDKVLILSDTDHDGRADTDKIFAEGLHLPTGIELGDGGVYVAQQPNLMFLRDKDGDDRADSRELILHGFDSADSHHSISAFEWGVDGALYLMEGTFHHTQVETPYGLQRCANAAVYRYEPRTEHVSVFTSYSYANPWGQCWDRWGQNFIADASGGANYFAAAFSGDVDHPRKHPELKQFLTKQWRPTCGCEIVSSRQFPDEMQGDYLLNNDIGFQGTLQYRMKDEGSGFHADPVEPLLRSSDPNFRPVDLQFGPDGALYVLDWFNPLIGHMQHSIRDPNRDKIHGRIWRITYKNKPLLEQPQIAGQPIEKLLDLLKAYEDRTRYWTRRELRNFPAGEVNAAITNWLAGLDANDPEVERQKLEALWVQQSLAAVDPQLLQALLASPEPRVRASAVRVLCYQTDKVDDPLALLQKSISDDNARVRIEAIRALSFFHGEDAAKARDIAYESLAYDQDDYIEYALKETLATLDGRVAAAGQ
ncbi:MAG: PVC-type heme-binding CxxCH protein [Planctomycetaceae bacterium]